MLLLPYLLTPLYRVIDPVSTPMLARWVIGQAGRAHIRSAEADRAGAGPFGHRSEDGRFCSHHGVDWVELQAAIDDADDIAEARGGSTITQQTAKNLFLWGGRSFIRKGLEFPLAIWIDLVLPKRRIMEIYLNVAEWGPNGEFGVEAGARNAFGKPASQVSRRRGGAARRDAAQSETAQREGAAAGCPAHRRHHPGAGGPLGRDRRACSRDRARPPKRV